MVQGNFLAICSDPETISRNSGIVWAMLQVLILAYFINKERELFSSCPYLRFDFSGVWTDWQYLCLLHVQRSGKNEHSFNNKGVLGCGYTPSYVN